MPFYCEEGGNGCGIILNLRVTVYEESPLQKRLQQEEQNAVECSGQQEEQPGAQGQQLRQNQLSQLRTEQQASAPLPNRPTPTRLPKTNSPALNIATVPPRRQADALHPAQPAQPGQKLNLDHSHGEQGERGDGAAAGEERGNSSGEHFSEAEVLRAAGDESARQGKDQEPDYPHQRSQALPPELSNQTLHRPDLRTQTHSALQHAPPLQPARNICRQTHLQA